MDFDAEHLAEHGDRDLKADAGKETHQHGLRKEVREKSQLEDARQQEHRRRQHRNHRCHRDVAWACHRREIGKAAGQNRGGRRIRRDHEVAGRTERGERDDRKQQSVEAGDHRCARDLRVTERLRDVHRGELKAGDRVADGAGAILRPCGGEDPEGGCGRRRHRRREFARVHFPASRLACIGHEYLSKSGRRDLSTVSVGTVSSYPNAPISPPKGARAR